VEFEGAVGWGPPRRVDFFIRQGERAAPLHLAFAAPDRQTVDAFHAAALAAGGADNGAPGLRPRYHADYYGAYVIDPDGHNVEAVCHTTPPSS
jgi:catechol 2,3-dioxygenase-like lactoylglutathione lyase family enzyme